MSKNIKHILVVDDDISLAETIQMYLCQNNFQVEISCDCNEAIEIIKNSCKSGDPFDLIIADILMPNMEGLELLSWIKTQHPGISVLVLSGYGKENLIMESIRAELDDYLKKPFDPWMLMAHITSISVLRDNIYK